MTKQLTVFLGGKDRLLDFGKFWFTKYYGEATGGDPLNSTEVLVKPEKQFDFVCALVFAGLRTTYKVSNTPLDFNRIDVEDWLGCLENEEVAKIINDYAALSKPAVGEGAPLINNEVLHGTN